MIKYTLKYYMNCDNCGEIFYDKYGESTFDSDSTLAYKAQNKGWCGQADEPLYDSRYHFCSPECREEYIKTIQESNAKQ